MDSRDFPLSGTAKQAVLNEVFNCKYELQDFRDDSTLGQSYFEFYRRAVEYCGPHSTGNTHQNVVKLVGLLKQPDATRNSVEIALRKQLTDDELEDSEEILADSINLAVRLLLMMPTGVFTSAGHPIAVSGETKLNWKEGTLLEVVAEDLSPQNIMKENIKLDKIFNARNLERIAGIEIRWTSNLADHLRMRDEDRAVEIFHYASFLNFHRKCRVPLHDWQVKTLRSRTRPLLSAALIDETLRTLALLLPEHDKEVETWFHSQEQKHLKPSKHFKLTLDPWRENADSLKSRNAKSKISSTGMTD